jgi:hypothetical protein
MGKTTRKSNKSQPMSRATYRSLDHAPKRIKSCMESDAALAQAQINQEYVRFVSSVLQRKITEVKTDTEEYNMRAVSAHDENALRLMECGQTEFLNGDTLKVIAEIMKSNSDSWLFEHIQSALKSGEYRAFPFTEEIAKELRARWLLKTDKGDSFPVLIAEMEKLKAKYLSDSDWNIIKKCTTEAESRLKKNEVKFIQPLAGYSVGVVRKITKSEAKNSRLTEKVDIDVRPDDHDLVAAKAMVVAMGGATESTITLAPGFFLKYMPEFNKNGFKSVICKYIGHKLVKISLAPNSFGSVPYGPVEAAVSLQYYFETHNEGFGPDVSFYVATSGWVAGEDIKNGGTIDIEKMALNTKAIPCAELFLFRSGVQEGVVATRLYFYPTDPSDISIELQTGSVVFGSEQTHHSCAFDPTRKFMTPGGYSNIWKGKLLTSTDIGKEPAVRAAQKLKLKPRTPAACLASDDSLNAISVDVSDGLYGENLYKSNYLDRLAPLPARFLLPRYISSGDSGLTVDIQPTFWRVVDVPSIEDLINGAVKKLDFIMQVQGGASVATAGVSAFGTTSAFEKFKAKLFGK